MFSKKKKKKVYSYLLYGIYLQTINLGIKIIKQL